MLTLWPGTASSPAMSGADAVTTVPPASYAAAVCGAIATVHTNTLASQASLQQTAQAFQVQPSSATASQLRQALVDSLTRVRGYFGDVVTALKSAGVPAERNGARFAKALTKHLQAAIAAVDPLVQQAKKIDVGSATRFSTTFRRVTARLDAISTESKAQAREDPAFQHVSPTLHPIVVYLTTSATTCPAS